MSSPSVVAYVACAAGLLIGVPALAATIQVGGACTLPDAVAAANDDAAVGGCAAGTGADTIVLESGATYTLASNLFINGGTELLIQGNGATLGRDAAGAAFRILTNN